MKALDTFLNISQTIRRSYSIFAYLTNENIL